MKYGFLIAALVCFFLASCLKQSGKTTVEGRVTDEYTGRDIPYATVVLEAENPNLYWGGSGTAAEYAADEHGKFSFSFDADADYEYQVNAKKDELYAVTTNEPSINKGRKNKNVEIKLWPMAFVKFHIIEVDNIQGSYLSIGKSRCSNGTVFRYPHLDVTTVCNVLSEKEQGIAWWTDKPDGSSFKHDTIVNLSLFDTAAIDVFY